MLVLRANTILFRCGHYYMYVVMYTEEEKSIAKVPQYLSICKKSVVYNDLAMSFSFYYVFLLNIP